jgi:CBS domain containing-hemolysin-like protein
MDSSIPIGVAVIVPAAIGLALTAAAETALERANNVRLQAAAARGDDRARQLMGAVGQPREFLGPLTAARVLLSALVVAMFAWIGARQWSPAAGAIGFGMVGGLFVAVVQMTVGLIAARGPEYAALSLAGVVRVTRWVFLVPAMLLGLPALLIARSLRAVAPRRQEDILSMIEREEAAGGVEEQEQRMIRGVIALEDKAAREIMIPRIDVGAVDIEDSIDDVAALVNERGFSRVPVYRENIDDIVGVVYAKDLLRAVCNGGRERRLAELLREPSFIPESKRLDQLLT